MRLKNLDLIAAILVVAINVAWIQILDRPLSVGIILALPLIFLLPGYTLTQTLFRKRSPDQSLDSSNNLIVRPSLKIGQPVGGADQIVLSLGLSLVIDVLVGFALNVLPIGLQALSWTLSLGLLTTVFALLAAFLRRKDIVKAAKIPRPRVTMHDYILFGLAILVASVAIWASIIRPLEPQPSFTQFWMLPANQANKSCIVSIGVRSFESTPVTYRVVMTIDGSQADTWSSIALTPQGEWVQSVPVKPGTASSISIEAQLYRVDKRDTVYRNVHLTFHISARSKNGQAQQQCTLGT
ncbi:MAG: DUF1616 domain-containing protein [Ktedonobacteraceae bacterium]